MVPIKRNPHFLLVYCWSVTCRRRYRIIDVKLLNWLRAVGQNLPGGRGSSIWTLHVLSISRAHPPPPPPRPKTIRDRVIMDKWMNGICRLFVYYVHSLVNHSVISSILPEPVLYLLLNKWVLHQTSLMLTPILAGGEGGVGRVISVPNSHQWALLLAIAGSGAGEREGWVVSREPETKDHAGPRWVQIQFPQSGTIQFAAVSPKER